MDFVTLLEQELGKLAAVLAGDAGDECFLQSLSPNIPRGMGLFQRFSCKGQQGLRLSQALLQCRMRDRLTVVITQVALLAQTIQDPTVKTRLQAVV
ncbi:MAG: hypothetical protein WCT47_22235 [Betaproteobacteria bacterium]